MTDRIPDEGADRGGMTGATGDLTSDNGDEEFVPAETRELTDPPAARQITEEHAAPTRRPPVSGGGAMLGGDERRDPEDEHL